MKTAEFGVPCKAPEPGRCRICGCTEDRACVSRLPAAEFSYDDPLPCGWVDDTRTLCDAPACVAAARSELTTRPAEADLLQRPYTGQRYGFAPGRRR